MMKIEEVVKNSSVLESIENYALVGDQVEAETTSELPKTEVAFWNNGHFWDEILFSTQEYWNKEMTFSDFVFSEWVPRVPGLGFTLEARNISRQLRFAEPLERRNRIYRPSDKSRFVSSGVGSLKLPPDYMGYSICAITSNQQSCQGIPILISPEVREYHKLSSGDEIVAITGIWQKMSIDWVKHFALTEKLPRGYLLVNHPNQIKKSGRKLDLIYDPCSIMEYTQDDIFKWDYVFCSVSITDKKQTQNIKDFFDDYKVMGDMNGKYLINPDIAEPIFDTIYVTPNDLKSNYAISQMALMKERMVKRVVDGLEMDELTKMISNAYQDSNSLRVFSQRVGIAGKLIEEESPLKMAIQLVYLAIQSNKILELIQRFTIEQRY